MPTLRSHIRSAALMLVAMGCSLPAAAELWGFVDGRGVAHFATRQLDARYARVMGGAASTDGRVAGKADARASLLTWLEIAPEVKRVQSILRDASRAHGVDVELLKAIIAVESGFNASAVSPRGAIGLMQITPETADRYAQRDERSRPAQERMLEPTVNVFTGARMLADLTRRYGSIDVALAAWNAGEGAVQRHGGKVPPFEETRAHVHLVLELYWALLQRSQGQRAQSLRVQAVTP